MSLLAHYAGIFQLDSVLLITFEPVVNPGTNSMNVAGRVQGGLLFSEITVNGLRCLAALAASGVGSGC